MNSPITIASARNEPLRAATRMFGRMTCSSVRSHPGSQAVRGLRQGVNVDCAEARVEREEHVREREDHVGADQEPVRRVVEPAGRAAEHVEQPDHEDDRRDHERQERQERHHRAHPRQLQMDQ